MSLPKNAPIYDYVADPSDVVEFYFVVSRGDGNECLLRAGEEITSYQLAPSAEAVAAGLQILTGTRAPIRDGLRFSYWPTIVPASRSLAIFDGEGIDLGIEATIDTDAGRTKQITIGIRWRQK